MNALELLFSPIGRINRLSYALLSGVFGAMNFGLGALIAYQSGGDLWKFMSLGPVGVISISPGLGLLICLGLWVQACMVFKRSQDMSGTQLYGWLFISAWLAPYLMFSSRTDLASSFNLADMAIGVPAFLIGMMLLFRGSREAGSLEESFDNEKQAADGSTIEFSELSEDTDLVARAAMLRAAERHATTKPPSRVVADKTKKSSSKGFGRRNLAASTVR